MHLTSRHVDNGDATAQQAAIRDSHDSGVGTWSAYSRNVGPGSTVGGYANDELGGANAGDGHVPGAPAASRADN